MIPQKNEPCNNCIHWKNECEMGRYNSASMIMFGYCGFAKPNRDKSETNNNNSIEL